MTRPGGTRSPNGSFHGPATEPVSELFIGAFDLLVTHVDTHTGQLTNSGFKHGTPPGISFQAPDPPAHRLQAEDMARDMMTQRARGRGPSRRLARLVFFVKMSQQVERVGDVKIGYGPPPHPARAKHISNKLQPPPPKKQQRQKITSERRVSKVFLWFPKSGVPKRFFFLEGSSFRFARNRQRTTSAGIPGRFGGIYARSPSALLSPFLVGRFGSPTKIDSKKLVPLF